MIPIPQSPWTLAIAELVGMRLATAGSSAHPADLLANLLPSGDPLPDGWFDQFIAGTPIPGYSPPGALPASAPTASSTPFLESLTPTAGSNAAPEQPPAGQSPLATQAGSVSPASPSLETSVGTSGSSSVAPDVPRVELPGWETLRQMLPGGSDVNPSVKAVQAYTTNTPVAGFSPPQPCGDAPRLAPGSASFAPGSISRNTATARGLPRRTIRSASGGTGQVQVTVQFDGKKLATEMYLIAKQVSTQSLSRTLACYAAQDKGSGGWRR